MSLLASTREHYGFWFTGVTVIADHLITGKQAVRLCVCDFFSFWGQLVTIDNTISEVT